MQHVYVVGVSGSGKTTLAKQLAKRFGSRHIELDAIHWQANWTALNRDVFRQTVEVALQGNAWVVDGNYQGVQDIVLARADTVVWLDYPLWRILWQLTSRVFDNALSRKELWNGNRETLKSVLLSKDSLFAWAIKTHPTLRKHYEALMADSGHKHVQFIRLRSPKELKAWLESISKSSQNPI
jgi:adenylate kinase family enzyme